MNAALTTLAYGTEYVGFVARWMLPSVLAPGNLPAVAASCSRVRYLWLTRRADAAVLTSSPCWDALGRNATIEFIYVDDEIDALRRGTLDVYALTGRAYQKASMSARLQDDWLYYLPPDCIYSDGALGFALKVCRERTKSAVLVSTVRARRADLLPVLAKQHPTPGPICLRGEEIVRLTMAHMHPISDALRIDTVSFSTSPYQTLWPVDDEGFWIKAVHKHPLLVNTSILTSANREPLDGSLLYESGIASEAIHFIGDARDCALLDLTQESLRVESSGSFSADRLADFVEGNTPTHLHCLAHSTYFGLGNPESIRARAVRERAEDVVDHLLRERGGRNSVEEWLDELGMLKRLGIWPLLFREIERFLVAHPESEEALFGVLQIKRRRPFERRIKIAYHQEADFLRDRRGLIVERTASAEMRGDTRHNLFAEGGEWGATDPVPGYWKFLSHDRAIASDLLANSPRFLVLTNHGADELLPWLRYRIASRLLRFRRNEWRQQRRSVVAVYGTGSGAHLVREIWSGLGLGPIECHLVSHPAPGLDHWEGSPLHVAANAPVEIDLILISSHKFEREMVATVATALPRAEILTFFDVGPAARVENQVILNET